MCSNRALRPLCPLYPLQQAPPVPPKAGRDRHRTTAQQKQRPRLSPGLTPSRQGRRGRFDALAVNNGHRASGHPPRAAAAAAPGARAKVVTRFAKNAKTAPTPVLT